MTDRFTHDLPFGASLRADGRAHFRLWAPAQARVVLELDGEQVPMKPVEDGWHEVAAHCGPGTCYRYRLEDGTAVPDPASRFQPEDVHGASQVIDPRSHAWQQAGWRGRPWHEVVIYELHAGALGGFAGVEQHLPRLQRLGITAIELMPIADFPGRRNWGYDGVLPFAPDSSYGKPDDLKRLVDAAHGLGLNVYLDVVYNHFGPDGNFLHAHAPAFFRDDVQTPWGAAIDFRRAEVRQFYIQNALYWLLEYRFDGLRFDAVHAIHSDDFLDELSATVRARIAPDREVHLMLENEHNEARYLRSGAFDAQWNDDFHNALHVTLTGEREGYYGNYADAPAQKLARCLAEGFAYQGEPSPGHANAPRGTASADVAPMRFIAFLQNHDQVGNRAMGERLLTLVDERVLRAAMALLLLAPHTPMLFMGEECGAREPFLFFTDFHDALADAVRDGRRKEFAKFAAFADAQQRGRIPDPNDETTFRRSIPAFVDGDAWAHHCASLLALRRERIAPRLRGTRSLGATVIGERAVQARWRLGDGALLAIAANFDDTALCVEPIALRLLYATGDEVEGAARRGSLPAQSTCAFLEAA